jgi:hypothetical protein
VGGEAVRLKPGHYFLDIVTAAAARIRLAGSGFLPYS